MMRVTAKLEINTVLLSLLQMVWLMVEQNSKWLFCSIIAKPCLLHYITQRLAVSIGTIVPSYDTEVANPCHAVAQKCYPSLAIKLPRKRFATIILMVAKASIYGSLQPMKFLCHMLFQQGAHADVYDVACNKHDVWLLRIYHVNPSFEFRAAVVVAKVKIAEKYYLCGLLTIQRQFLIGLDVYPKSVIRKSFLSFSNDRH